MLKAWNRRAPAGYWKINRSHPYQNPLQQQQKSTRKYCVFPANRAHTKKKISQNDNVNHKTCNK